MLLAMKLCVNYQFCSLETANDVGTRLSLETKLFMLLLTELIEC